MIFYGLMAVGNTVMLLVVILLLGYGLAEYPISLWQEARIVPSLKRYRCEAWEQVCIYICVCVCVCMCVYICASGERRGSCPRSNVTAARCGIRCVYVFVCVCVCVCIYV